jgi:hypothetical protein
MLPVERCTEKRRDSCPNFDIICYSSLANYGTRSDTSRCRERLPTLVFLLRKLVAQDRDCTKYNYRTHPAPITAFNNKQV